MPRIPANAIFLANCLLRGSARERTRLSATPLQTTLHGTRAGILRHYNFSREISQFKDYPADPSISFAGLRRNVAGRMSVELLVNVSPRETRIAVVENGVLQEVFVERANRRGRVGNIYKGRVCRVLPGMQAAFVDIGLDRAAFLHASDVTESVPTGKAPGVAGAAGNGATGASREEGCLRALPPDIGELLEQDQEIVAQVLKDPIGGKGARLTTHLSIPSRYLVYMPGGGTIGVSQRIEDPEERNRLRYAMQRLTGRDGGGFEIREPRGANHPGAGGRLHRAHRGGVGRRAHARQRPGLSPSTLELRAGRPGDGSPLLSRIRRSAAHGSHPAGAERHRHRTRPRGLEDGAQEHPRVHRAVRPPSSLRASSTTRANAPSSICTGSRTRSARRSTARWR